MAKKAKKTGFYGNLELNMESPEILSGNIVEMTDNSVTIRCKKKKSRGKYNRHVLPLAKIAGMFCEGEDFMGEAVTKLYIRTNKVTVEEAEGLLSVLDNGFVQAIGEEGIAWVAPDLANPVSLEINEDEKAAPKKSKKKDDDDEDEAPKKKRGRPAKVKDEDEDDDDDDEKPVKKGKKPKKDEDNEDEDDEDEDEKPASKKRGRPAKKKDDEDEDEKPAPKKRGRPAKVKDEDEDDDDDDEKPVKKGKKPAKDEDEDDDDEKPVKKGKKPAKDEEEEDMDLDEILEHIDGMNKKALKAFIAENDIDIDLEDYDDIEDAKEEIKSALGAGWDDEEDEDEDDDD